MCNTCCGCGAKLYTLLLLKFFFSKLSIFFWSRTIDIVTQKAKVFMSGGAVVDASAQDVAGLMDMLQDVRDVSILMIGKGGSGKRSLANAILRNNSSGGHFGADRGNIDLFTSESIEVEKAGVKVTVHDIVGFEDSAVPNKDIKSEIERGCSMDRLSALVVCFKWDDRFDMVAKRILKILCDLEKMVWEKVIFALTHCDQVPPDYQEMDLDGKNMLLRATYAKWRESLTVELGKLKVNEQVISNVKIVPTTHTSITLEDYSVLFSEGITDWLENLWFHVIETVPQWQQIPAEILTLLRVYLLHRPDNGSDAGIAVTVEDVEKFLTKGRIKGIFLGGTIGGVVSSIAGGGVLSGVLLSEVISAVIGISTACAVATAASGEWLQGFSELLVWQL